MNSNVPMGFCPESFPPGTHMCLIYSDQDECDRLIAKFLHAGLENGEKTACFTDRMSPPQYEQHYLQIVGDARNGGSNRLQITQAENTYCPGGQFTPEGMMDRLRRFYETARAEGFANCRATGEMTWATKGIPGSERLIEYEAKLNFLLPEYPVTAICQYDAKLFDGATLYDVLRVHPMMIVRDQIVRNPYYVLPEEFLQNA